MDKYKSLKLNKNKKQMNKKKSNKKKKKKSKTYHKTLTHDEYYSIEYPYYNLEVDEWDMLINFNKLKKFKYKLLAKNPINKLKLNKFEGKLIIFEEDYYKNKNLYRITDYFSESCRMRCIYNSREKTSPFDIFTEKKDEIFNKLSKTKRISDGSTDREISFHDFNEYMFKNYKQCTSFNTTIMISLLKLFKPTKVLDMSSGWGDRLVGALAYGNNKYNFEYLGTDPSNCMEKNYKNIISTLIPSDNLESNYKVIKSGFETANIPSNYFDLMFSSPPFFDLEIYENSNDQSIQQFNSLQTWLTGFMYPSIHKIFDSLVINGYMALYVSDYSINGKKYSYVNDMKKYIASNIKQFEYSGDIHWWDKNNKKTIRKIFVWKKIANIV